MPLRFATEPANGSSLVHRGLTTLSRRTSPLSQRGVDFTALSLSQPHPVYDLRADAVAGGRGLESAVFTGFRYLVQDHDQPVAAAEVQVDASGNATLLSHINYGPYVGSTARGFTEVAALSPVGAGSYETRLLRFSAVSVMALWLKSDAGGADIIYPLSPAPDFLQVGRAYSADEFIHAVRPLAQKRVSEAATPSVP